MTLTIVPEADARAYREAGAWGDRTIAGLVEQWSVARPHADAYITATRRMTWVQYHDRARALAGVLVELGFERGARVGVMVPDGPAVHVVMLGCELAGVTAVGIGARAGAREIAHLLGKTGAAGFVTPEQLAGVEAEAVFAAAQLDVPTLRVHVVVDEDGCGRGCARCVACRPSISKAARSVRTSSSC